MTTELFFWNKHKPNNLTDILHNGRNIAILNKISKKPSEIPHIYLTGLQTDFTTHIAKLIIKKIYGEYEERDIKFVLTPSITVTIKSSNYHYEFDMNYYKYMRRDIPLLIINKIVRYKNISNNSYNIIVIQNANHMTFSVQAAFRRLMEQYTKSCRFFFTSKTGNGLIDALRSRCLCLNFKKPEFSNYRQMLQDISSKEELKIKDSIYEQIYENCEGVIDGINLLQLYSLNKDAIKYLRKYSPYNELMFYIRKGDIRYFNKIQTILFNLHSLDISYTDVIKKIIRNVIEDDSLDMKSKAEATHIAATSEWRCACSNRSIVGLNYFVGNLIKIYSKKI